MTLKWVKTRMDRFVGLTVDEIGARYRSNLAAGVLNNSAPTCHMAPCLAPCLKSLVLEMHTAFVLRT
jgi:hypothetical protein